jgi:hypothetical protein
MHELTTEVTGLLKICKRASVQLTKTVVWRVVSWTTAAFTSITSERYLYNMWNPLQRNYFSRRQIQTQETIPVLDGQVVIKIIAQHWSILHYM